MNLPFFLAREGEACFQGSVATTGVVELLEQDSWSYGDVWHPATVDVATGDKGIFFNGEDVGGVDLGCGEWDETSSLGCVSIDIDEDRGTLDLIATTFLRIPRGMLVATNGLAFG